MIPKPVISVLMPTRSRPELCHASASSMLGLAKHPELVEFVLRRDLGDTSKYLALPNSTWLAGPSQGYAGLHEYYNECAAVARGAWFVVWNDDCVMRTPAWDEHIAKLHHSGSAPMAMFHGHFPTLHRRWYEATGRVAASPHADTYICHVAEELITRGYMNRPDGQDAWDVLHRCDEELDEGSVRRKAEILGPDGTSAQFFRPEMRAKILADAEQIAATVMPGIRTQGPQGVLVP